MPDSSSATAPPGRSSAWRSHIWPQRLSMRLAYLFAAALCVRLVFLGLLALASDPAAFDNPVCRWDCGWYLSIVKNGYDLAPHGGATGAEANWAFFPLYPILVRLLDTVLPMGPITAATTLSILASAATAPVLYAGYRGTVGGDGALFTAAALTLSPFGLYASVPYTEALFGLLLVGAFGAALNRRWLVAGLAAALLSATRTTGILIVLPFIVLALQHYPWRDFFHRIEAMKAVLAVAMAPIGAFTFMLFLHHHMGDALAFSHVQAAWARDMGNPLAVLMNGLRDNAIDTNKFYWAMCAVFGLGLSAFLAIRRRPAEALWQGMIVLIPLSTALFSLGRYIFSGFTPYLALALIPGLARSRLAQAAILAALLASWYFFIMGWVEQAAWTI